MRAVQWEVAAVVIETRIVPVRWLMTGRTIRAELALVFVILLVAGITVGRRAFILAIHVARLACHFGVLAFQLERGQVVIERGRSPALGSMTLAAVGPETPLVRLVVLMAGVAILRGHREICSSARIDMALHTGQPSVLPCESE